MEHIAMIIAPHPDDAELGMGGTIAALIAQGVKVVIVDLTDGEPTPYGSPAIRAQETSNATAILGNPERRLLTVKNREVFDTVQNRRLLATVIREVRPRLLFIPYWEDAHPDHRQAHELAMASRFYAKLVKSEMTFDPWYPRKVFYYFSTHLRVRITPTFIFNMSEYLETKIESIQAYASQFVAHRGNAARIEAIRREAQYWGDQIGAAAGEPFVSPENIGISDTTALFNL